MKIKAKVILSFMLFAALWSIVKIVNLLYRPVSYDWNKTLWYFTYWVLFFLWFNDSVFKRDFFSRSGIIIISFFIMMLGIFTKRSDGPSWLLCIVYALLFNRFRHRNFIRIIPVLMFILLLWFAYRSNNITMPYVSENGELQVETNINSRFYKIGIKGQWLSEMKNLSRYINEHIKDNSFVEIPCEDPVYWASGTKPRLNFFQIYPETCPYDKNDLAHIVSENDIKYVIVKRICQFKYYMLKEEDMNSFISQIEFLGYKKIHSFGVYEIFYRKEMS